MGIFPLRGKVILVNSRKGPTTVLTSSRSYSVFDMLSSFPEKGHEIPGNLDPIGKITIRKLSPKSIRKSTSRRPEAPCADRCTRLIF